MLDERDGESGGIEVRDGQRNALDRDRSLLDEIAEQLGLDVDPDPRAVPLRLDRAHNSDPVDMTLDVVTPERFTGAERRLEVHLVPEGFDPVERLDHHVEGEVSVLGAGERQADAVDRDGVADLGGDPGLDHEPTSVEGGDPALLPHNPREHDLRLQSGTGPSGPVRVIPLLAKR